jgi:hypothetical protein
MAHDARRDTGSTAGSSETAVDPAGPEVQVRELGAAHGSCGGKDFERAIRQIDNSLALGPLDAPLDHVVDHVQGPDQARFPMQATRFQEVPPCPTPWPPSTLDSGPPDPRRDVLVAGRLRCGTGQSGVGLGCRGAGRGTTCVGNTYDRDQKTEQAASARASSTSWNSFRQLRCLAEVRRYSISIIQNGRRRLLAPGTPEDWAEEVYSRRSPISNCTMAGAGARAKQLRAALEAPGWPQDEREETRR